ncbi:hypothetical protein NQD34_009522 [Periophthalmus magnuspinnatus]|uniref:high affinity immunoglobulin epsilon receptor subunit alpha-like n=1 Tax=Periophthalmus magnuspinnatus TaxID=409849 RepID=UPI00145A50E2|nr:high affinity immunoglobulin epsilon receptor subunit alpha-like [Periophthalmus magnuspinnatus]KAJ0022032.1 hypothetical protein NQD34_009522 [Periophthalmus magnuspinnatus]
MDRMSSLFMFSIVLLIYWKNPVTHAAHQPIVEIITGSSKVFTGEAVTLKCVPPATPYKSIWTFTWYKGPDQLPHFGEKLVLRNIKTKDNGKYYCQGYRDTAVIDIPTFRSLPVEINADGGWAILDVPSQAIVGHPLNITCRVRNNYPIHEVILYRNDVEVIEREDTTFILNNLTLEDQGQYTCRASWNKYGRTYSVISAQVSVKVVEPLTQPTLFIVDDKEMRSLSKLKLICMLSYNIPDPAPPVIYYFYINNNRHGTPTSDNYAVIERIRGTFKCQAKVSQLGLSRWSEPKTF